MRLSVIKVVVFLCSGFLAHSQNEAEQEFIELYKANYLEWITSPQVRELQAKNPDLAEIIARIPIQETALYKEEFEKMREGRNMETSFDTFLSEDAIDYSLGVVKELLAPENTEIVTRMYWRIINSPQSKEIGELLLEHMQKLREDVETAIQQSNIQGRR